MNSGFFSVSGFRAAVTDYRFFLDKGYPEKQVRKLVGDRYRLSKDHRMVLFRAVFPAEAVERNMSNKAAEEILDRNPGPVLYIDAYNVLITCMNYLLGKVVFLCDDGFFRDIGGSSGRVYRTDVFERAVELLVRFFRKSRFEYLPPPKLIFDRPVYNSSVHAELAAAAAQGSSVKVECRREESVDRFLKSLNEGALATSDSEIIGEARIPVIDLAYEVIRRRFQPAVFDIRTIPRLPVPGPPPS